MIAEAPAPTIAEPIFDLATAFACRQRAEQRAVEAPRAVDVALPPPVEFLRALLAPMASNA